MRRFAPLLALSLALAACGSKPQPADDLNALDAALVDANAADPALTAALHDQIMVDPKLAQSSNGNAVRPPPRPDPGSVPTDAATGGRPVGDALTLGALAGKGDTAACAAAIGYSATWSTKLPEAFPVYPDAAVAEAAGTDANGCTLRVVSFAANASPAKALAWYAQRARTFGYSVARSGDGQVGGQRGAAMYVVYAQPRKGGGSDVDLIVNGG